MDCFFVGFGIGSFVGVGYDSYSFGIERHCYNYNHYVVGCIGSFD